MRQANRWRPTAQVYHVAPYGAFVSLSRLFIPAVIVCASVAPGALQAAEPTLQVAGVEIIGAKHVHPDRVRFIVDVRQGRSYITSQLQQAVADDVRAIEKMGPFTQVKADLTYGDDGRTVTVRYRFVELPYVGDVRYETFERVVRQGYNWRPAGPNDGDAVYDNIGYFDQDKLKKLVDTKPGTYLNPLLLENDRCALLRKLQDDGHRYARVVVETPEADGTVTVIFRIDTTQEIEVGKVLIQGLPEGVSSRTFEPGVYNPSGLFNDTGKPYQPELVSLDEGSIIRILQDLGWLDAKLISTRREITDYVRPTEDRRRHGPDLAPDGQYNDRVVLIYTVEPGERYRLGKVDFLGNTVASSSQLLEAFAMPEGSWFKKLDLYGNPYEERRGRDLAKALGAIERSRRTISNQGYARCEVGVDRRLDTKNHIVDLTIHVTEGGRYKVGRVDVRGNLVTRDAVIRRGMAINPGDRWNDDDIDESRRQIERTGIFNGRGAVTRPLKIEPQYPEDRPGEVDLEVDVDEKATGSLRFELGFSSAAGVFGSVGYSEGNFDLLGVLTGKAYRGAGQTLSFDVYASQDRRSVATTWTNPHLLDGPYELSVNGYRSDSSPYEWSERRLGGSVSVGRRFLNNDLAVGVTYGYFDMVVTNVGTNAANDVQEGHYYENSNGLYQTYDRLNDRQLPTSGFLLRLNETAYGSPLPGSDQYAEYSASGDSYLPLYEVEDGGVTFLRFKGQYKLLDPIGDTEEVPFFARYRGGGQAPRHRGFGDYDLSPKQVNVYGQQANVGGTKDLLLTAEMSFPVMGTNDGIRLVAFTDYGNVWGQDETPKLSDMRTAVGFGIRFPIQLPVSLDFAWLLDRRPGDDANQIHFGLGITRF